MFSPVWRAKLCRGFSKESRWRLNLESSDQLYFEKILDLLCGMKVEVADLSQLLALGRMADLYGMEEILAVVEEVAIRMLDHSNCAQMLMESGISGLMRVERCCRTLALNNFDEFAKTEGFLDLCETYLEDLLEDDNLKCDSEETIFEALVSWMRNGENLELRGQKLLNSIRFPLMPREYVENNVRSILPEIDHSGFLSALLASNCKAFQPRCCQKEVDWANYSAGGETLVHARSDTFSLALCKGRVCCGMWDGSIALWNAATMFEEKSLIGHTRVVCALLSWKHWLISASSDHLIMVWNVSSGLCEKTLQGHTGGVNALAYSNESLISASDDTTVKIWNISGTPETWSCLRTLGGHRCAVRCVVASGARVFSGSADKTIRAWNLANGSLEHILRGHKGVVHSLAIKGSRLISGAADGKIKQWSLSSGICLSTMDVCEEQSAHYLWCMITSASKIVCGFVNSELQVLKDEGEDMSMKLEHSLKISGGEAVRHLYVDREQVLACVGRRVLMWGRRI